MGLSGRAGYFRARFEQAGETVPAPEAARVAGVDPGGHAERWGARSARSAAPVAALAAGSLPVWRAPRLRAVLFGSLLVLSWALILDLPHPFGRLPVVLGACLYLSGPIATIYGAYLLVGWVIQNGAGERPPGSPRVTAAETPTRRNHPACIYCIGCGRCPTCWDETPARIACHECSSSGRCPYCGGSGRGTRALRRP